MRYFLQLSYQGTRYSGWQRQQNAQGVQDVVEEKLGKVLQYPVWTTGCGRTDAGVHARTYFLHFDTPQPLPASFLSIINKNLPDDIAVQAAFEVSEDCHARYSAVERAYDYHLHTIKTPAIGQQSTWLDGSGFPLDVDAMQLAADALLRYNDFRGFCKAPDRHKTTLCVIREARLYSDAEGQHIRFHIRGNRFLRGMVRLIMAQLIRVGQHQLTPQAFEELLATQTRPTFFIFAPPQGLHLVDVVYPQGCMGERVM